jgi:hypothetical protein
LARESFEAFREFAAALWPGITLCMAVPPATLRRSAKGEAFTPPPLLRVRSGEHSPHGGKGFVSLEIGRRGVGLKVLPEP